MKRTAQLYLDGEPATRDLTALKYQQQWSNLAQEVLSTAPKLAGLKASISKAFGTNASALVARSDYLRDVERVGNLIIALKLTPSDYAYQLAPLWALLNVIALIGRAAASDATLDTPGAAATALSFPTVLPDWLFPMSLIPEAAVPTSPLPNVATIPSAYPSAYPATMSRTPARTEIVDRGTRRLFHSIHRLR